MIKRCTECSTTIAQDLGNLCEVCSKAANDKTLKLITQLDEAVIRAVPRMSEKTILDTATKIMQEQRTVLQKLDDNASPSIKGVKFDQNKPDLSLLPRVAKEGIARAFMDGQRKYGRYNYLNGMEWTRILAAIDRHLSAFNDGEDIAIDSQLNHLYHAGAGIMMLIEYYDKKLGTDNRYKK